MKFILLATGVALLVVQRSVGSFDTDLQFTLFLIGIVVLGVPHGAADILVEQKQHGQAFRPARSLIGYVSRLLAFALLLWLFPVVGAALFLIFSAYHFGETDLTGIRTDNRLGQSVVLFYGIALLGIVLLGHADEVRPILAVLDLTPGQAIWMERLFSARLFILGAAMALFFTCCFAYFLLHPEARQHGGDLLARFALLVLLLHFMPLLLGFTFYFVLWHSLLSLSDILRFLRRDGDLTTRKIVGRMAIFSVLALGGILFLAFVGSLYASSQAMVVAIVIGLAVLTAPHLGVMHDMYARLRSRA